MALLTLSLAVFPSNCQSDLQGTFEMLQKKRKKEKKMRIPIKDISSTI